MKHAFRVAAAALCALVLLLAPLNAYDLSRDKVQYVVVTSHLDTQWQWTIDATRMYYLPLTTQGNFMLFEKYPGYIFNYESAFHYMLIKQLYPQDFARIKQYVDSGAWHLSGGMLVACDVNVPSPESLIRQMLYGNGFFQQEFGRKADDVFLPDCFGFGYVLPSVAAHCGMIGFSTQKVYCPWLPQPSGAYPKPFDIGMWQGVDGSRLVAAINPGGYVGSWDIRPEQIEELGRTSGVWAAYDYMGTGDKGGACCCGNRGATEKDVQNLFARIARNDQEEIKVVLATSDQLYRDLTPEQKQRLKVWNGELLARQHGVGTYTSRAFMKQKNRRNELGAQSAECAAVLAGQLAGKPYPAQEIKDSWIRFLWHQMHDDITGTSIIEVYEEVSVPDEDSSFASFSRVRDSSLESLAGKLDTRVQGVPLVVFNPLGIERQDPVTAEVAFDGGEAPAAVRVFDSQGRETPSQVLEKTAMGLKITFLASAPSCGAAVYEVRPADSPCALQTGLKVDGNSISNGHLTVKVGANGEIASLTDLNDSGREALAAPSRLELFHDRPEEYPQWEIRYQDIKNVIGTVDSPAKITVLQNGPVTAVLRVEREHEGSRFVQEVRLSAGSRRVEVANDIDWQGRDRLLKAAFTASAACDSATYDLQLGVIRRPNDTENLYEVPGQHWADLTDRSGAFGLAVLNDCKYGWDKPADNTLRLTLLHSPLGKEDLDHGPNRFTYALCPHAGDWRKGAVVAEAARLNQPLVVFQTGKNAGTLGKSVCFLKFNDPSVTLMALKQAENGQSLVLRVRELNGAATRKAGCTFPGRKISQAFELNGLEETAGPAKAKGGELSFEIGPYQVKTFSVALEAIK